MGVARRQARKGTDDFFREAQRGEEEDEPQMTQMSAETGRRSLPDKGAIRISGSDCL